MRKKKRNLLIGMIGVLAVLLVILAFVRKWSAGDEEKNSRKETLLSLSVTDIAGIRVRSAANAYEEIAFIRTENGWQAESDPDTDYDSTKIAELAASFTGVRVEHILTDVKSLSEYSLEKPTAEADLTLTDGTVHTIAVGGQNDPAGVVYCLVDGDKTTVYAVAPTILAALDRTAADYLPDEE